MAWCLENTTLGVSAIGGNLDHEKQVRKAEILTAVTHAYASDEHQILRYTGEPL